MIFVLVLIVGVSIVFWIHKRFQRVHTYHLEKRLRWIHNHNENYYNQLIDGDDDGDGTEGNKEALKTNDGGQIIQITHLYQMVPSQILHLPLQPLQGDLSSHEG